MKINVTREHIIHGIKMSGGNCPVSLAIKQAAGIDWCSVGPDHASVWHPANRYDLVKISLPEETAKFVSVFDSGAPVQPFAFELAYPEIPPTFWQTTKRWLLDWWNAGAETCPMCGGAGTITVAEKPQQKELCHDLVLTK